MKRIISVGVALGATAVLAAACSGATGTPKATNSTTAPATTPASTITTVPSATTTREAAEFLRLALPYDDSIKQLDLAKIDATTTGGLQASLGPVVAASNKFTGEILGASFTGRAATAARTMAIAVEAVVADIQSVTITNWTSERPAIAQAEKTVGEEANVVRVDVGLRAIAP
ncbi:MAG: hypothetical protein ABSG36_16135 [Acidimicrobiales bacterium]|jgi:hypothetical protein